MAIKQLPELSAFIRFVIQRSTSNKSALKKKLPQLPYYTTAIINEINNFGDNAYLAFERGWELGSDNSKLLYRVSLTWKTNGFIVYYYSDNPITGVQKLFPKLWKQFVVASTMTT